jgi:cytochrome c biogenesis protein
MNALMRPLRLVWRRLTSMRTALILLFLLAVAAVPGSILPQRPLNPDKTKAYIAQHGTWGRLLDSLGMYDVFGSVWFAAIYLLLFVSLVGCLIPRIRLHARASIRKPLPAPRNLDRLPEHGSFETSSAPAEYAGAARSALGRRWRVTQRVEDSGALTLSAEKGYSRETGNLLFHIALLVSLVLIAVGRLYNYEGSRIVVEGADQGFCNTVSQYDTWKPGRFAAEGKVSPAPFCIDEMTSFVANYTATGEPTEFTANLRYRPSVDAAPRDATLQVNRPLRLEGDRVYLINHGFAPRVTVTMPDGSVQHDVQAFVPTDASTLLSEGAFKEQGRPGAKQDVGIAGLFAPTPQDTGDGVITSISPQVKNPVLAIIVYLGDLNYNGLPQSVYALDHSKMSEIGRANMTVGETKQFGHGVTVRFDGWVPWVSLQISHDPTQGWLLLAAGAMVLGLLASLGVRRRRLWLRVRAAGSGGGLTVVDVGGLARSDTGNFTTEFAALLRRLQDAAASGRDLVPAGKE